MIIRNIQRKVKNKNGSVQIEYDENKTNPITLSFCSDKTSQTNENCDYDCNDYNYIQFLTISRAKEMLNEAITLIEELETDIGSLLITTYNH